MVVFGSQRVMQRHAAFGLCEPWQMKHSRNYLNLIEKRDCQPTSGLCKYNAGARALTPRWCIGHNKKKIVCQ
jgi:hypothetical protein